MTYSLKSLIQGFTCSRPLWALLLAFSVLLHGPVRAEDKPAPLYEQKIDQFVETNREAYKRETEILRAYLWDMGRTSILGPEEPVSLPEPRTFTIKTMREVQEHERVTLAGSDFIADVQVSRPPLDNGVGNTRAQSQILDGPPFTDSVFWQDFGAGALYAADDLTARVLRLPRSIPIEVRGSIARVSKRKGACNYTYGIEVVRPEVEGLLPQLSRREEKGSIRYDKIDYEGPIDLSALLKSGRGDFDHIGIDLSGTNLELDAGSSSLLPIAPGTLNAPGKITWSSLGSMPAIKLVKLPENADLVNTSPECWESCPQGPPVQRETSLTRWEQGKRPGSGFSGGTITDILRREKDPYLHVPYHRPARAVALQGVDLRVEPTLLRRTGSPSKGVGLTKDTTDFFILPGDDMPKATIRFVALVYDGDKTTTWDALSSQDELTSTGGPFEIAHPVVSPTGDPGKTTVTYGIAGEGPGFHRSHTFTANRVELRFQAPRMPLNDGKTQRVGETLAVGVPCKVAVAVQGPANMEEYRVVWGNASDWSILGKTDLSNRDLKFHFEEPISRFSRKGDQWIAQTQVTVSGPALQQDLQLLTDMNTTGSPFNFATQIAGAKIYADLSGQDNAEVMRLESDWVHLASPPLTKIAIKGLHTLAGRESAGKPESGPFDLFLSEGDHGVLLCADLQYGEDHPIMARNVKLGLAPTSWIRIQQDSGHLLQIDSPRGRLIPGGETGRAKVRAVIRRSEAGGSLVTLPEGVDSLVSNALDITVNRAYLILVPYSETQEWTLAIEGPADMSTYSASWHRTDGQVLSRPFSKGSWKSSIGIDPASRLSRVDVVNATGTVVASLSPGNTPSLGASVNVEGQPGHFEQGAFHPLTARIYNLPPEFAAEARCQWGMEESRFDGTTLRPLKRPLRPEGDVKEPSHFTSDTKVFFRDNPATAGTYPVIWADVYSRGILVGHGELRNKKLMPGPKAMAQLSPEERQKLMGGQEPAPGRGVEIEVIQVRNIRGNNPLNPDQPVFNLNGRTFETLDETLAALTGVSSGIQGTCTGTFTMRLSGGAPATHRFASLEVDPNTGQCRQVHEDGSSGSALIVQTPPDAEPSNGVAFPDALVGVWRIISPPPNSASGRGILLSNNTLVAITIQSTAGVRVQVILRIVPLGGNEYNLEITSFRRL